jgi:hypothetical protein
MGTMLRRAIAATSDPALRTVLEQRADFVNLEGLKFPCVGVRVPLANSEHRAFSSFTADGFHQHTDDDVAKRLVDDLATVLTEHQGTPPPVLV